MLVRRRVLYYIHNASVSILTHQALILTCLSTPPIIIEKVFTCLELLMSVVFYFHHLLHVY